MRRKRRDHADDVSIADVFPDLAKVDIEHEAGNAASYAAWKERLGTTQPISVDAIKTALDGAELDEDDWSSEHLLEGTHFAEALHDDLPLPPPPPPTE